MSIILTQWSLVVYQSLFVGHTNGFPLQQLHFLVRDNNKIKIWGTTNEGNLVKNAIGMVLLFSILIFLTLVSLAQEPIHDRITRNVSQALSSLQWRILTCELFACIFAESIVALLRLVLIAVVSTDVTGVFHLYDSTLSLDICRLSLILQNCSF